MKVEMFAVVLCLLLPCVELVEIPRPSKSSSENALSKYNAKLSVMCGELFREFYTSFWEAFCKVVPLRKEEEDLLDQIDRGGKRWITMHITM